MYKVDDDDEKGVMDVETLRSFSFFYPSSSGGGLHVARHFRCVVGGVWVVCVVIDAHPSRAGKMCASYWLPSYLSLVMTYHRRQKRRNLKNRDPGKRTTRNFDMNS